MNMAHASQTSQWRKHCDESIVLMRQRKDVERVKDDGPVGDGREQPVEVVLIDSLREESDDLKEPPGVRAEFSEHRRGQREPDRSRETLVISRLKDGRLALLPLPGQSDVVPLVLMCDCR